MNDTSNEKEIPAEGCLLGLDYGEKRVGLAICTPDRTMAVPLETYHRVNDQLDTPYLQQTVKDHRIVGIVIGLPVHMNGEEGRLAMQARQYGEWVAEVTELPITFWDERLTSAAADELLNQAELTSRMRKQNRDRIAAQIILESWLAAPNKKSTPKPYDE